MGDPSNKDRHGRTCVAFEHSSQDYNAVASCALAWGCDYTRYWSGGKTYIRNPPTFSPSDAPTTPQPTFSPSDAPTTSKPTFAPSEVPTTSNPTFVPSKSPIITPPDCTNNCVSTPGWTIDSNPVTTCGWMEHICGPMRRGECLEHGGNVKCQWGYVTGNHWANYGPYGS